MASTKMVFQRLEKKYLMTSAQKNEFMKRAEDELEDDVFAAATICNIYFDTDQYSLITSSIQKPPYKEKLRMRSYGIANENKEVYLEIKKKCKGIVNKRRISMNLTEAAYLLEHGKLLHSNTQIHSELSYFMQYYQPKPKVFIAYERSAYSGSREADLRITFDSHIRRRYDNLDLSYGDQGDDLLKSDQILMEIKVPGAYPLWLTHILSDMKLYPISFSKYGTAFLEDIIKTKQLCNSQQVKAKQTASAHDYKRQKEGVLSCLQVY